jgi:DNA-binding transcriptional regulator YiaG
MCAEYSSAYAARSAETLSRRWKRMPTYSPEDLQEIMKSLEIGPTKFAKEIGVSYHTVYSWMTGRNVCVGSSARAIELYLKISQLEAELASDNTRDA